MPAAARLISSHNSIIINKIFTAK